MTRTKASDFLKAMSPGIEPDPPARIVPAKPKRPDTGPRAGFKHFGGLVGKPTLEQIALLRVNLDKDNSELIELAIDELFKAQKAKRAFGD